MGGSVCPLRWGLQAEAGHLGGRSEVGGLRRSWCPHHLPVVSQSSGQFLSELHVAEGRRSPPKALSFLCVCTATLQADLEAQ